MGIFNFFSSVLGRNRPNTTKYALKWPKLPLKRPKTYKNPYPHCLTPPLYPYPHFDIYKNIIKYKKLSTSADPSLSQLTIADTIPLNNPGDERLLPR